jgi:hypothetical protein
MQPLKWPSTKLFKKCISITYSYICVGCVSHLQSH